MENPYTLADAYQAWCAEVSEEEVNAVTLGAWIAKYYRKHQEERSKIYDIIKERNTLHSISPVQPTWEQTMGCIVRAKKAEERV